MSKTPASNDAGMTREIGCTRLAVVPCAVLC
jgi:hypothetical protein